MDCKTDYKTDYKTVKNWLEEHVHRIFNKNTEEFYIMENILKKHPNYENWKNKNIKYFKITRCPKKNIFKFILNLRE